MTRKKIFYILFLVLGSALVVRVIAAMNWHGLVFDEIFSLTYSSLPVHEMWQYLRHEMHPPLHFFYLHAWMQLFSDSEVSLRFSSIPLSLIFIASLYALGTLLYRSRVTGLYAAGLAAFAARPLFNSIFARMYMLTLALGSLSCVALLKALHATHLRAKHARWWWSIYAGLLLLVLYTHLTALALPAVYAFYVIYAVRVGEFDRAIYRPFFISTGCALVLYMPWFLNFLFSRLFTLSVDAWFIRADPFDIFYLNIPNHFLLGSLDSPLIAALSSIVILALVVTALFNIKHVRFREWRVFTRAHQSILPLLIAGIPMITLVALQLNSLRFYLISSIGVVLLMAEGLRSIHHIPALRKITVGILIGLLSIPLLSIVSIPSVPTAGIARFIESQEQIGDKIVTPFSSEYMSIKYYYRGNLAIDTAMKYSFKEPYTDDLDFLVKTNSIMLFDDESLDGLRYAIGTSKRIFFVFDPNIFGQAYLYHINWLYARGWQKVASFSDDPTIQQVWLLTKNK